VNRGEQFDRFDFDDHLILDYQVGPETGIEWRIFS
jgi:hypothetical protein